MKVLAGCVETLILEKYGNLFIDIIHRRQLIGHLVKFHSYRKPKKIIINSNDYRYGCCDDVLIRNNQIIFPNSSYASLKTVGNEIEYSASVIITWLPNYRQIIKKCLKEAEFVFTKVGK